MLDVLSMAERLENLAGQIYQMLTGLVPEGSEGHALFTQLKDEELQHEQRVQLLQRRYMRDRALLLEQEAMAGALQEVIDLGESLLSRLQAMETIEMKEAMELTLDLEQRFAVAHADAMLATGDRRLRTFFQQLARQDRAHASLLSRNR